MTWVIIPTLSVDRRSARVDPKVAIQLDSPRYENQLLSIEVVPQVNRRFPLIDSLRAIAALAVLLAHTAFLSGAIFAARYRVLLFHLNVGVSVFFVISGFLLYRPFVAARRAEIPAARLGDYAVRRAFRIFPAYWFALTVLAITPGLFGVFTGNWWVYYGLLQIYPIYDLGADCITQAQGCGLAQAWSLAVEFSFYAFLPLFAALMRRLTRWRGRAQWVREAVVLGALGVLSLTLQVWVVEGHPTIQWMNSTILAYFAWFAMGMGLALVSVEFADREDSSRFARLVTRWPLLPWLGAVFLYVFLSLWLPNTADVTAFTLIQHIAQQILFGAIGLLLLLPAVFGGARGGLPRRILGNRALLWLGQVSYGVFLWHLSIAFALVDLGVLSLPGSRFVNLSILTLLLSAAAAALSYYLIESPLMKIVNRRTRRKDGQPRGCLVGRLSDQSLPHLEAGVNSETAGIPAPDRLSPGKNRRYTRSNAHRSGLPDPRCWPGAGQTGNG